VYNLKSNEQYSTYNLPLTFSEVGQCHNNALYENFNLLNRIGDDPSLSRLKDVAHEETSLAIEAGYYPVGTDEVVSRLYNILIENEGDIDRAIELLREYQTEILLNKELQDSIAVGFINLTLHSSIFWKNFFLDNPEEGSAARVSFSWGRTLFIAGSDLLGGLAAGWKGGQVGLKVGTVFGNPGAGLAIGAIGGFLLGGAVASGGAYYASR